VLLWVEGGRLLVETIILLFREHHAHVVDSLAHDSGSFSATRRLRRRGAASQSPGPSFCAGLGGFLASASAPFIIGSSARPSCIGICPRLHFLVPLAASPGGQHLAAARLDGSVQLWRRASPEDKPDSENDQRLAGDRLDLRPGLKPNVAYLSLWVCLGAHSALRDGLQLIESEAKQAGSRAAGRPRGTADS